MINFLLTAVAFFVIFSVLILVHEWGHFVAARKSGVRVMEFGFGLPPRIWGVKKGEVIYSLNWIPFGGFVRLFGEDSADKKILKDKRSFSAQPIRIRAIVCLAGVSMNFLLSFVLLTLGYTIGMQPLMMNSDDIFANVENGNLELQQGIVVKEVTKGGAAEGAGMQVGDNLKKIAGKEIFAVEELDKLLKNEVNQKYLVEVIRGENVLMLQIDVAQGQEAGFQVNQVMYLPRIVISEVRAGSRSALAGVLNGDIVLKVNGKEVFLADDFSKYLSAGLIRSVTVLRNGVVRDLVYGGEITGGTVISAVYPDSPAEKAGFRAGDVIRSIDGQVITDPQSVVNYTKANLNRVLNYLLVRGGKETTFSLQPQESGLIGVGLTAISDYQNYDVSFYATSVPTSVMKVRDVRYPIWEAPVRAMQESGRLALMTVEMFGNVIHSIFTRLVVPDGVAGPIGILQMTSTFVQEGLMSLLRFMALLSLSLAIINILPIPALDGGRLLFLVFEAVSGKRISPRHEAIVHAIGYVLLMLMIVMVTYNDLRNLLVSIGFFPR